MHLITILINIAAMISPTKQPVLPEASIRPAPAGPIRAEDLLRDRRMLVIEHAGERYLLRLTRNGKLILTK